ncbi:N-formylglutamate deformylase [Colwellia sp. MSW7]|uniref:N-formylglutamate deformylase n=1 Tax=Colwellia maritima TaxID=2912588 RepID=A0ABS9WXB7_9GAMM|nr:N-formylglutamate deformylase [Colwellia maritima]MCI2282117.1 N-formylglutamate deformylase [Colwellia maritima]
MNTTYSLSPGNTGMLISMPHNGENIPKHIAKTMTNNALKVADTDWYIDKLYDFAKTMGIYTISPKYSRYVIDLNRDPSGEALYVGQNNTELCPTTSFNSLPLYLNNNTPTAREITDRIEQYWYPYHSALKNTLMALKQKYGKVILLDAHSILSNVPRFFEGKLPDFNFGTADGLSCDEAMVESIKNLNFEPFSCVYNERFKGGYITRAYGDPKNGIHAIQLELSQDTYLNETNSHYDEIKAEQVKKHLKMVVKCLVNYSNQN